MKNKRLITIMLSVSILCLSVSTMAYHRSGTGKISGGASGLKFYIESEAYDYKDSINNGILLWNGLSTKVSVSKTTTKSSSRCDNYWGDYFSNGSGIIATTYLQLNNQDHYDYDVDWYWCKIKYNSSLYCDGQLDFSHRKAVAAHEYGHFLGLAHNSDSRGFLMYPYGDECTATAPTSDEVNGIKAIYGS